MNEISSGIILMSNEHLMVLFHLVDADSISFAESSVTKATTANAPYSGSPIVVVIEVAPLVVADATALTNAADAIDVNIMPCPYSLSLYISFLLFAGVTKVFISMVFSDIFFLFIMESFIYSLFLYLFVCPIFTIKQSLIYMA